MVIFRLTLDLIIDDDTTLDEMKVLLGEWVQEHDFDCGATITRLSKGGEVEVEYIEVE